MELNKGKTLKGQVAQSPILLKDVNSLDFKIIQSPEFHSDKTLLNNTYQFWKKSWEKTFQQLQVEKSGTSDDFLNKEIGGLFLNEKPIGLLMYHFIDLQMPCFLESSYFDNYPVELLEFLQGYSGTTMIITYMTLDKEWRSRFTTHPISELLISFSVLRFLDSPAQRILGYFRNDRGTQEMFYRHGGMPIMQNAHAYNVDIDFAIISKEKARLSKRAGCDVLAMKKWNEYKLNNKGENDGEPYISRREDGTTSRIFDDSPLGGRKLL